MRVSLTLSLRGIFDFHAQLASAHLSSSFALSLALFLPLSLPPWRRRPRVFQIKFERRSSLHHFNGSPAGQKDIPQVSRPQIGRGAGSWRRLREFRVGVPGQNGSVHPPICG